MFNLSLNRNLFLWFGRLLCEHRGVRGPDPLSILRVRKPHGAQAQATGSISPHV